MGYSSKRNRSKAGLSSSVCWVGSLDGKSICCRPTGGLALKSGRSSTNASLVGITSLRCGSRQSTWSPYLVSVASIGGVSIATPSVSNRVCRVVYDELAGRGDLFRGLDEGLAQSVGVVINVTEGHLVSTLTRL